MVGLVWHSQRKQRETDRLDPRTPAPVFDSTQPKSSPNAEGRVVLEAYMAKRGHFHVKMLCASVYR